jgi:DNA-binding transcriptional MocR family regulator
VFQLIKGSATPLGDQLFEQLSGLIESGQLPTGARLPSVRKLAGRAGVSPYTVTIAFERLLARGLVEARPGSGHFVAGRRLTTVSAAVELGPPPNTESALGLARSMIDQRNIRVPAGSGMLPPAWFNEVIPGAILSRARSRGALRLPSPAEGDSTLRELVVERLRFHGVPAVASQILMTAGASQAIDLIARTMLCPGDTVLVDDPCYFVLLTRLQAAHVRLIPVPKVAGGSDLQILEAAARMHRPRMFFTQTVLHNPTGITSSVSNVHGVLRLAEKYNFVVVEDHVYSDFGPPQLSLAQLDELRRVIYIGSFSKVLCPGMRIGFLAAPGACLGQLIDAKVLSVLRGSALDEQVLREVLASGKYRKHLQKLRERVARASHSAQRALNEVGLQVNDVSADSPFIWARAPASIDVRHLAAEAREQGILLAPGSLFSLTAASDTCLRFNVAYSDDARLTTFLEARLNAFSAPAGALG